MTIPTAMQIISGLQGRDLELHEYIMSICDASGRVGAARKVEELLLQKATPWNLPPGSQNELSLIDYATNNPEVVELLLNAKAMPTDCSLGLALRTNAVGRERMVSLLLNVKAPLGAEVYNSRIETALHHGHNLDVIRLLVAHGASVHDAPYLDNFDTPMQPGVGQFLKQKQAEKARADFNRAMQGAITREDVLRARGAGVQLQQPMGEISGDLHDAVNNPKCPEEVIELLMVWRAMPALPSHYTLGTLQIAIGAGRSDELILRILDAGGKLQDNTGIRLAQYGRNNRCSVETIARLRAEAFLPLVEPAASVEIQPQGAAPVQIQRPPLVPPAPRYCASLDAYLPSFIVHFLEWISRGAVSCWRWILSNAE